MAPLLIDHGWQSSRRVALLTQAPFSSKVAIFSQLKHGKLLAGNYCGGLMAAYCGSGVGAWLNRYYCSCGYCCWNCRGWNCGDSPNSAAVGVDAANPRWGIHHAVLWRSTARTTAASRSRHHPLPLFLIGLSNSLHHPLLVDGCTCQLIVR
jgi:hypothetical protein